ncbi:MAG: S49 family peptidase [Reyranella sp.]|jgi:protease-4|uniref:S49 family peptidase n=1 Tax=Reyranella sp. TaxID=1929291 RepID=UPI0025FE07E8|nr:S49 family peptidase [Reyranella sp.]MBR2819413.1 S49 family peptidase [Reyranella sp.]
MRRYIVGLLATVGALTLLAVAGIIAFAASKPFAAKPLPQQMVLSLDLRSLPPETTSTDLLSGGLFRSSRDIVETVQLLWQAADDPRVTGLYVEIGDQTAGLARVQELRQAIAHFRGKGKFAIGFAESLGSSSSHFADYYLATSLEQIWLQPSGGFGVAGISVETPFLKTGLDKLGVKVEGGKRYEYKSAPDSFLETGYTRPARDNLQQLLDSLFGQFIADSASDRRLEAPALRRLIDSAPHEPEQARRDGLIDKIGYRTDVLDEVYKRAGNKRDLVTLADYAADEARPKQDGEVIALVRASGAITSGPSGGSPLEEESLANADDVVEALEDASKAKEVRAIVLRIDSPGGTYPAADAIADAVGRVRAAGKPVIVSMSDVAASGGYLAAVRGDVIVAQPTTITASIGVFSIWPMAHELLASLGVNVERVSVGTNAGMYSPFQSPSPAQQRAVNRELDTIYSEFTRVVADARKLNADRLDAAARGRVFSGVDAKKAGLIDELGGLQLALSIARAKAGIDETKRVELRRYPDETERWQRLFGRLFKLASSDAGQTIRLPREAREALARLGITTRPGNVRLPPLPPLWQ